MSLAQEDGSMKDSSILLQELKPLQEVAIKGPSCQSVPGPL